MPIRFRFSLFAGFVSLTAVCVFLGASRYLPWEFSSNPDGKPQFVAYLAVADDDFNPENDFIIFELTYRHDLNSPWHFIFFRRPDVFDRASHAPMKRNWRNF